VKHEITKHEDGSLTLKLGLTHAATFEPRATTEEIVMGVNQLVQTVVGLSVFELAAEVVKAFAKKDG